MMKNTCKCRKCGGTHILEVPGSSGAYGAGNNIQVGWTTMSAVLVNRYVCCSCGYIEEWIDPDDIPALEKKFCICSK